MKRISVQEGNFLCGKNSFNGATSQMGNKGANRHDSAYLSVSYKTQDNLEMVSLPCSVVVLSSSSSSSYSRKRKEGSIGEYLHAFNNKILLLFVVVVIVINVCSISLSASTPSCHSRSDDYHRRR
jgi:hypothetical protein